LTEPADLDAEIPRVTLAGKAWPIPELVWTQLRKCRRELIELNGLINAALAESAPAPDESALDRGLRQMGVMEQVFLGLSNDDFDRLVMAPIYLALSGAHPDLSRDEFDAWRLTETERQLAWLTVRRQSGLFIFRDVETPSGEDVGAA
jgi:hypothetical protein